MQNEAEASPLLSVVHTPPPLPQEVFISIFSHLRPKDLYRVGLVCKSWNQVLRNDNLWRTLFFRCFGEPAEPGRPSSQAASVMSSSSSFWRTKFQTAQNWYKKEGQGYTSFALHRGVDPLPNVGGGQSQQHHPQQSHEEQQQPPPNAHMGGVLALRLLSPSVGTGRKIAISGGADAALMIWDVTPSGSLSSSSSTRRNNGGRGKLLGVLKGHRGPVWAIDCTATQFASASDDATVKVWDLNRGRLLRTLRTHSAPVLCVQMDADKLLSGGHDGTLSLCDLRTGKETAATIKLKAYTSSVRSMHQPRQEENHVIVGTEGGRVKVLDLRNGRCVQVFKEHARFVSCLHADAQRIISGSPDWTVKVWDRQTGECTETLEEHMKGVWCLKFDEQKLITGGEDHLAKIWDMNDDFWCINTLRGHRGAVRALDFDSSTLITGGLDRSIRVWNFAPSSDPSSSFNESLEKEERRTSLRESGRRSMTLPLTSSPSSSSSSSLSSSPSLPKRNSISGGSGAEQQPQPECILQ